MRASMFKPVSEAEFLRQVLTLAKRCGWRTAHFRPARTARGWRTAVQGDGVGFPDIILVRGGVVLVAELKVGNNRPSPAQAAWLKALRDAGLAASVWRPRDWPSIEEALR